MTDREKAIKDLEDVIAIADGLKGLPSQYGGIIISLDKIDSLRFALESLKADASDKTDRGEAIATLTEHLNHWKRLLSAGICTKDEGERTINALTFAIESIKALDEIIAKIEEQKELRCFDDDDMFVYRTGLDDALYIIDKYRKEQK